MTGLKPSKALARRIPPGLPLERGMLTCLCCHAVAQVCTGGQETMASNHYFRRGSPGSEPLMFCFQCHAPPGPAVRRCGKGDIRLFRDRQPKSRMSPFPDRPMAISCTTCHDIHQNQPGSAPTATVCRPPGVFSTYHDANRHAFRPRTVQMPPTAATRRESPAMFVAPKR